MKYLVEGHHCDLYCFDEYGKAPIHWAVEGTHFDVVKYLIETAHCDPNCMDKVGGTLLHYAAYDSFLELVNYLLVVHHCDPNCKTTTGLTPIDYTVAYGLGCISQPAVVTELIKAGGYCTRKARAQSPVKVFIVGNPSSGKSSLTKALQTEKSALGAALASITGRRLVSDVEQMTAGIVPCLFTSRRFGSVRLYDFAGQQEYYASHAALLQNSISSSAPLFIIVVNLCDSEEDIKQKLMFWLAFLANQCTALTTKPHVIIVGSHSDVVRSKGEDARTKVTLEFLQNAPVSSSFYISKFIPMDCRCYNSSNIVKLAESMKESCEELRKQLDLDFRLYSLYKYLCQEVYVRQDEGSVEIEGEKLVEVSSNASNLHDDLCELNDRGHIVYLKGAKKWVILDQTALLSEVNGVLFAPEGFKQHYELATATGVVPVSKLVQKFPKRNPDMLVEFLCYFQFCCEVKDHEIVQLINPKHIQQSETAHERYLFFPALVRLDAPSGVWETNSDFPSLCGWMLQCCEAGQFLTSQFLQVLLLCTAFSYSLVPDTPSDLPVIQRKCSIWKNGIYWGSRKGVEALVEIRDPPINKEVVVMLRCMPDREVKFAHLRSSIIKMVLEVKEKLCPLVSTTDFFLHPSQVREYPFRFPAEQELINIREVSTAIVEGEDCVVSAGGCSIDLNKLLLFEPYTSLGTDILQQLFSGETKKIVSDRFLYAIADRIYHKKDIFIAVLHLSRAHLSEKIRKALNGDIEEFVCVLQCWRGDSGTYQSLRETLDQFSVFAGRNPLVSGWYILSIL